MSNIQSLGNVIYMDDGKDTVATCELKIRDTNSDGQISDPQSQLEIDLRQMDPSPPISTLNDIVECNPGQKPNIFSSALADTALRRMGIHVFTSPSLLLRNSSDYTQQIPSAALKSYVTHMSQAENLSRTYLGDKSVAEIKSNLQKIEQHLEGADRFEDAVHANFGEKTKFEDKVKQRAYTRAANEIGKRAVVFANEAVASNNSKSLKVDQSIQLLREYRDLASSANLSLTETEKIENTVIKLLSILSVDVPI